MAWDELARCVAGARDRFAVQAERAAGTQAALLRDILRRNANCAYGQRHGFGDIAGLHDFAHRVPPVDADVLAPEIAAMASGEGNRLVGEPVVAFERTGGSSGGAKLIPYTASGLANLRAGLYAWLDDLGAQRPAIRRGSSYWSISPATRAPETTASGVRIGMASDAEYFGEAAYAIASLLAVPPEVGAIEDVAQWRLATLTALLQDASLSLVSVWSPTFWLELCRHAADQRERLVAALASRDPRRAREVDAVLGARAPDWSQLWPQLALISCWTHASAAPWAEQLARQFPRVEVQGKGLLATEGLVSLPWCDGGDPIAAIGSTVLEFEDDAGRAWPCDAVETGREYTVLMTTAAGLYRYRLGDRVRVTGWFHSAPRLRLLGRSSADSDLCGEKLTEAFVMQCWSRLRGATGRLVPRSAPQPHYRLLLDAADHDEADAQRLALALDDALHANPQYAYARKLGQLACVAPRRVPALAARMQQAALAHGQRLGDAKPGVLGRLGDATE